MIGKPLLLSMGMVTMPGFAAGERAAITYFGEQALAPLSFDRNIHRAYARVREGNFALEGLFGFNLHGRTVGVVGAGRIGTGVARHDRVRLQGARLDVKPDSACTEVGVVYVPLAKLLAQVAKWQGRSVFAFTRPGDHKTQDFARSSGATWAGGSDEMPPQALDAAIIFATVGGLVPLALKAVRKGGRVVRADIHNDIPSFPHGILWKSAPCCRWPT